MKSIDEVDPAVIARFMEALDSLTDARPALGGVMLQFSDNPAAEEFKQAMDALFDETFSDAPVRWMTIQQAADLLSCSTKTIRRRIESGDLRVYRLGKRFLRVDFEDVLALLSPIPVEVSV